MLLLVAAVSASTLLPAQAAQQRSRWRPGPIKIAISQSLLQPQPNIKTDSDVTSAITRAIEAWKNVADIDLVQVTSDRSSVSPTGIAGDGISLITIAPTAENVSLFKSDVESAAKTRVFVDKRGFISEADIVLSPFLEFSSDGSYGTFDLESTIRHEIGHLLGLRHSSVVGSVMYDVASRNGVFGETGVVSGALTEDDLSAIRDLYDDGNIPNCCGVVNGKLVGLSKNTSSLELWLQHVSTGKIAAHASAGPDGAFRFGGIEYGEYEVVARGLTKSGGRSTELLGDVTISSSEPVNFAHKVANQPLDFSTELLGKNGILSDSPLMLHRGTSYSIYIGGRDLRSDRLRLEAGSPFMSVVGDSLIDMAYDEGVSGIKFTLNIDGRTPPGNYSICAISLAGSRDCVPGGIVVLTE